MKTKAASKMLLASGDYLAVVRDFALSKGISPSILLKGSDIKLEDLLNPPHLVPNLLFSRVGANLFYALNGELSSAIEFGLKMTAPTHGPLGVAVRCSENIQEAYEALAQFYNTRINFQDIHYKEVGDWLEIRLAIRDEELVLESDVLHFFDLSTLVSVAVNTFQSVQPAGLAGRLTLMIDAPEPTDYDSNALQDINLVFDAEELVLKMPLSWLSQPLSIADAEMAKAAREQCLHELEELRPPILSDSVFSKIESYGDAIPTLEEMAAEFYMSAATFKRKLKDEGATYQSLKDQVRRSRAEMLIREGKESIEEIALMLGFNNASNFSKSFKNWTGQSPSEFRSNH